MFLIANSPCFVNSAANLHCDNCCAVLPCAVFSPPIVGLLPLQEVTSANPLHAPLSFWPRYVAHALRTPAYCLALLIVHGLKSPSRCKQ